MTNEEIAKLFERCDIKPGSRERVMSESSFSLRSAEPGEDGKEKDYSVLSGRAIVYDTITTLFRFKDWYDGTPYEVQEKILRNAVDKDTDMSDVVLDINHDCVAGGRGLPIARTRNKSLELVLSDDGVDFNAKVNHNNQRTMQAAQDTSEGLVNQCSFAFNIEEKDLKTTEEVRDDGVHVILREISHISKLADVSIVTFPAYSEGTHVELSQRSAEDLGKFLDQKHEATKREAEEKRAKEQREAEQKRTEALRCSLVEYVDEVLKH